MNFEMQWIKCPPHLQFIYLCTRAFPYVSDFFLAFLYMPKNKKTKLVLTWLISFIFYLSKGFCKRHWDFRKHIYLWLLGTYLVSSQKSHWIYNPLRPFCCGEKFWLDAINLLLSWRIFCPRFGRFYSFSLFLAIMFFFTDKGGSAVLQ